MEPEKTLDIDRADRPNPCCRIAYSLDLTTAGETLFVETCRVCGCRHFVMVVDPIPVGLEMNKE